MQTFLLKLIIAALSDQQVQKLIKDLLGNLITERIVPLVPVAAASAAKAVVDLIPGVNSLADVGQVAESIRVDLNNVIPDFDLGIPALDNLFDFWRPRG